MLGSVLRIVVDSRRREMALGRRAGRLYRWSPRKYPSSPQETSLCKDAVPDHQKTKQKV